MSHTAVGEVVPFNLKFPKHFLKLLQYVDDLFTHAGHLQVVDMLGQNFHQFWIAGYCSGFHTQLTINGACFQAARSARDLCKFESETSGCIILSCARLLTMKHLCRLIAIFIATDGFQYSGTTV